MISFYLTNNSHHALQLMDLSIVYVCGWYECECFHVESKNGTAKTE